MNEVKFRALCFQFGIELPTPNLLEVPNDYDECLQLIRWIRDTAKELKAYTKISASFDDVMND